MSARVLVAMSGGVDSSVTAALLREAGHDVTGVTLKLWGGDSDSGCCSVADVEDARRVCAQLGIDHYVFNFTDTFDAGVVGPYVDAYAAGRTPNPCIECNRVVKFGRLLERADALGFEIVATGHHARVTAGPGGRWQLRRAVDHAKDQSYVLSMLGQPEMARVRFPVGEMPKAQVRAHAARLGLRTALKPESMDVCFITKGGRKSFLAERGALVPGMVKDTSGAVVGEHDGAGAFTIGQRRGVDVAVGERRYVVDVDTATATITIGRHDELLRDHVDLDEFTFVDERPRDGTAVDVQMRAHGTPVPGWLDGSRVVFAAAQPRVAPGQTVALYDNDVVLGAGIVTRRSR